jgi:hypothetical protein
MSLLFKREIRFAEDANTPKYRVGQRGNWLLSNGRFADVDGKRVVLTIEQVIANPVSGGEPNYYCKASSGGSVLVSESHIKPV